MKADEKRSLAKFSKLPDLKLTQQVLVLRGVESDLFLSKAAVYLTGERQIMAGINCNNLAQDSLLGLSTCSFDG